MRAMVRTLLMPFVWPILILRGFSSILSQATHVFGGWWIFLSASVGRAAVAGPKGVSALQLPLAEQRTTKPAETGMSILRGTTPTIDTDISCRLWQ